MKLFFVFGFCLVFLPSIIHASDIDSEESEDESDVAYFEELRNDLDGMAANGGIINRMLRPTPNGFIGEGCYGLVYKGIRTSDLRPVAMKFIDSLYDHIAEREYAIYTYLNAINRTDVERFGIPAVYYYGEWEDYIVMAITLCDADLLAYGYDWKNPLNILILFRQFVRQSKYLHGHGVRHDDIKPQNIMIRNYQCFLIDYNWGAKFNEDKKLCTFRYKPRRCHNGQVRLPVDDWESFFYAMCEIYGVNLKWFDHTDSGWDEAAVDRIIGEAKADTKHIQRKVNAIKLDLVKNVFVAFYNEIFGERVDNFPDYDEIDSIITAQIVKLVRPKKPVFFTWMGDSAIRAAHEHMNMNPIPNIRTDHEFENLGQATDFDGYPYPHVNINYFDRTASESSRRR